MGIVALFLVAVGMVSIGIFIITIDVPRSEWTVAMTLVGGTFSLFGFLAIHEDLSQKNVLIYGDPVCGMVKRVERYETKKGNNVDVSYSHKGQDYLQAQYYRVGIDLQEGDVLTIIVDRNDPRNFVIYQVCPYRVV